MLSSGGETTSAAVIVAITAPHPTAMATSRLGVPRAIISSIINPPALKSSTAASMSATRTLSGPSSPDGVSIAN